MPSAEIITIGTELLLGEILDSNAQHIAKELRGVGVDLLWTTTVGDNLERIAEAIQTGLSRSDILICTGGLGPTIDDMTREGIANGLGVELEFQADLWEGIKLRFSNFGREASENNKRQAFVPKGAIVIDNPNGSAPAFLIEQDGKTVFSMPGVPREMVYLLEASILPYLRKHYGKEGVIVSRILHTAGIGESLIDERITDLEEQENPTVGLAAHTGAVDIRLTAKAPDASSANEMLDALEGQIRDRIGDWIYGRDGESQAKAIQHELKRLGWEMGLIQKGFDQHLKSIFDEIKHENISGKDVQKSGQQWSKQGDKRIALAAELMRDSESINLIFSIDTGSDEKQYRFSFGGQQDVASEWASKIVTDHFRRYLLSL